MKSVHCNFRYITKQVGCHGSIAHIGIFCQRYSELQSRNSIPAPLDRWSACNTLHKLNTFIYDPK